MPIPKPKTGEKEEEFVARCISQLADEDPNTPNAQRVAICFSTYKQAQQEEKMDTVKRDEKGRIIVAENVKINFGSSLDFIQEDISNGQN